MRPTRPSMQELIRQRRRAGFVGRGDERAAFRANLDMSPEDERHRFLFHVHGNAGVGKSFLVRELEQVARERGALTAYLDDGAGSVPEVLELISRQFAAQGRRLKDLERLLSAHRERRHEAELAAVSVPPTEPPGPSAGSVAVARASLVGLGMVPGVGAFAGALDPAQLAQHADRLRSGIGARFRSHEDAQLVLDPESVLTPVLLDELSQAAPAVPWIVLFFDTYERTGRFVDGWLHTVMTSERYGALPATVVVVTAGQLPFDSARWGGFGDFMTDLPLQPFTEPETRGLLAGKGVVAEPVVSEVLRLTGGLPVLVSTLAESRPADPQDVSDPSTTAVERFLKWEADPVRRSVALACALPRKLDADVFRAALDVDGSDGELDALYAWLRGLPFVSERGGRVTYHDVVRAPMLRLQRRERPRIWATRQRGLAAVFTQWRTEAEAGRSTEELWTDEGWRELRLAELYHLLCAGESAQLSSALRDVVDACEQGSPSPGGGRGSWPRRGGTPRRACWPSGGGCWLRRSTAEGRRRHLSWCCGERASSRLCQACRVRSITKRVMAGAPNWTPRRRPGPTAPARWPATWPATRAAPFTTCPALSTWSLTIPAASPCAASTSASWRTSAMRSATWTGHWS